MEKSDSSLKIFNIVLCVIILITFVLFTGIRNAEAKEIADAGEYPSIKLGYSYKELTSIGNNYKENIIVYNLDYYIETNKDTIEFFSKAFNYNLDDVIYNLKQRENENDIFLENNIGYLKDEEGNLKVFDNFEQGLIEYFYNLNDNKEIKRNETYKPYEGSSDYIEDLIIYYSSIYNNVDANTMLSIGAAESGYYKVKYMLRYNNVYGGMSSHGLIKHNNIELGVLSYIRMMSKHYYGKGLDTIYSIGRVYCPVIENGNKIASPHWINLVNKAKEKYNTYNYDITIEDLINKTEVI